MATITARVDDKKKQQLTKICKKMGLSVGTLINMWIHDFVHEPKINIALDDTHWEWYENKDMIDVGVPATEFLSALDKIIEDGATT